MPKISTNRDIHLSPNSAAVIFHEDGSTEFVAGMGEIVDTRSPTFFLVIIGALFKEENFPLFLELRQRTVDGLNAQRDSRKAAESLISRSKENPHA